MATFTPFSFQLPTWKALLQPTPAGGNYTITATCTGCGGGAKPAQIENVAFGDVWICSGQSNAMLWVSHTFSRNESARNYSAGSFSNIRIMGGSDVNEPYASWPPAYGGAGGPKATNAWMTAAEAAPAGCVEAQNCPLFQTSGACWYALQELAEQGVTVPLGLVALTLGGQRIEEFMNNNSGATGPYVCENLNSQNIVSVPEGTRGPFLHAHARTHAAP
jgi:sialate O-acetylesterase